MAVLERFGPYEIVRRLGAGGMAETFLAVRRGEGGFEQHVCLKRILPAFAQTESFTKMFLQEAQISALLRHSHIVQVYDFGKVDDTYYMALELIEGVDLRTLLRALPNKRLPPELVCLVAHDILVALDYAHQPDGKRGIILHRDISPANVLVSPRGELKLSDFGIAKVISSAEGTDVTNVKGKTSYMAAEYILGKNVDARVDLFALGVMLYELLLGVRPFDGTHELITFKNITEGHYKPVLEVWPEAPKELAAFIESLIQLNPKDRPKDAASALEALPFSGQLTPLRKELGRLVSEHISRKESEALPLNTNQLKNQGEALAALPTRTAHADGQDKGDIASLALRNAASQESPSQPSAGNVQTLSGTRWEQGAGAEEASNTKKQTSTRRWMIAMSSMAILIVGALAWVWMRPISQASPASKTLPTTPAEEASTKAVPVQTLADASSVLSSNTDAAAPKSEEEVVPAPTESPSTPSRAHSATLRVKVEPFGNVWIDNRRVGKSPYVGRISPGTHVVGAGNAVQATRKTVVVKPGKEQRVTLSIE